MTSRKQRKKEVKEMNALVKTVDPNFEYIGHEIEDEVMRIYVHSTRREGKLIVSRGVRNLRGYRQQPKRHDVRMVEWIPQKDRLWNPTNLPHIP